MTLTNVDKEFIYVYGVCLAEELQKSEVPDVLGIDHNPINIKIFQDLAALVTPVNATNYSQQQIDLQLKDAKWLQGKAFHHHEIIADYQQNFTILPIAFCTIFQTEGNLESLLTGQYHLLLEKLTYLKGKQEWNLKLFCDSELALSYVLKNNPAITEMKQKLVSMPKGKQFLMRKKLDQLVATEFELEQAKWRHEILPQLGSVIDDSNLRQNWGKEVTERKDEMVGNYDFLIHESKVEQFLNKIAELEKTYEALGCSFQVTGPWPPYHFAKFVKEKV